MKSIDQSSRQRLIDAALELFRERGYGNVAIKDICEAADCSNGTFYYHFKSMNGLIQVIRKQQEIITPELLMKLVAIASPWEKLWLIHSAACRLAMLHGVSLNFQLMFAGTEAEKENTLSGLLKTDEFIVPIIKQGQAAGEIRNQTDAAILANTVGLTIVGVESYWYLSNGQMDLEAYMKRELENLYDIRPDLRG